MKKIFFVSLLLIFSLLSTNFVSASFSDDDYYGLQRLVLNENQFNTIGNTQFGAFTHSIPISTPQGRNNLNPNLNFFYNSQNLNKNNIFGYGWDINIPYIERLNKTGTDKLYTDNYFTSSLSGELVLVSGNTYAPKVEDGKFLTYTYDGTYWTVKSKDGKVYKFGQNAASRQNNSNDTKTFKWMLEEERDTNDNYIKYEYFKDSGQIYPSKIKYTGNGSTDGIFEVEFLRETRNDKNISYEFGFLVETFYRINEIQVKINNSWNKKYELSYSYGDNTKRSLLHSITEIGKDEFNNTVTLPADVFYYQSHNDSWTEDTNWSIPENLDNLSVFVSDINADSLPDIIKSELVSSGHYYKIWVNNGVGGFYDYTQNWSLPIPLSSNGSPHAYTFLIDVNGDNWVDILNATEDLNSRSVYINNGDNTGWTENTNYVIPFDFESSGLPDHSYRIFDVNGDNLIDVVSSEYVNNILYNHVYINNGDNTGWTENTNWTVPVYFSTGGPRLNLRIFDVNGDNLTDIVYSETVGTEHFDSVYINNGLNTWTEDTNWTVPVDFEVNGSGQRQIGIMDVNNDGLIDIVDSDENQQYRKVYINDGVEWHEDSNYLVPVSIKSEDTRFFDINGDGMVDFNKAYLDGIIYDNVYINDGDEVDLISKITTHTGSIIELSYKASLLYKDSSNNLLNPNLPLAIDTVNQIITKDENNNIINTETYSYEGGSYYFNNNLDKKFAGFNKVIKTDSVGNKTVTYYHQGNANDSANGEYSDHSSKIGQIYRQEIYDNNNNLYKTVINKWDRYNQGTNRDFVKLVRSTTLTYDGDNDHKDIVEEYVYDDDYGNLNEKIYWGEVNANNNGSFTDTGTDKYTETTSYALNTSAYIVGLPEQEILFDQNSDKIRETKTYYDDQALGSVTNGNITKVEKWKEGNNYVNTQTSYNTTYGIPISTTDERGNVTNYVYDSYNLYPETITNPLGQITSYLYDYSLGKPKQVTDMNNFVYQTVYDGLDRIKEEKIPNYTSPFSPVLKTSYTYNDTSGAILITKNDYLDDTNIVSSYQYFDGLNRLVQERQEMENTNEYSVRDIKYNSLGLVEKESVPYTSSGSAKTSPTTTSNLYKNYTYDPLYRIKTTVDNIGTTTNTYDDWKTSMTDANGNIKHYYKDAYDNLMQVDEINDSNTYSTYYEWNGNNLLTKITDALGNVRNFTYDGLGRRLSAEDLHSSSDAEFGVWNYTYDDASNMTESTNPNGEIVLYTYNEINQLLSEVGQNSGQETSYSYGGCDNGEGKVCRIQMTSGANSDYTYDALGNIATEQKTINANNFTTSYTYNRQGNILEIIHPDNSKVKNNYNQAGQLESIQKLDEGETTYDDVVLDFDYGPHGKVIYQENANGIQTYKTYDADKLYRLTRIQTINSNNASIQDLNYSYDANNNITQIIDNGATNASKTVTYTYDDLNRLLSATATNVANEQNPYTENYTYDAIGNILTGPEGAYSYSNLGYYNPHAVSTINTTEFTYDNAGNLLTEGTRLENTWNYKNQLISTRTETSILDYLYDHNSDRVLMTKDSDNTYFVNKYYKVNPDGSNVKNIYALDNLVASLKGQIEIPEASLDTDYKTANNIVSNTGWANFTVARLEADDSARATCNGTCDDNDNGQIGDFNFDIPANATIDGIEFLADMSATLGEIIVMVNLSHDNGTTWFSGKKLIVEGNADSSYILGSYNDTWDRTWTPSELSNSNFIVQIDKDPNNSALRIDQVLMKVYYRTPAQTIPSVLEYIHTDHLNSTNLSTDESGTVISLLDYYPYGSTRIEEGNSINNRKYIGQEFDQDTELNYLNARYYEGTTGRFISQDPSFLSLGDERKTRENTGKSLQEYLMHPQALNSYSYAGNNPINRIDPTGKAFVIDDAIGFVGGGLIGAGVYALSSAIGGEDISWSGASGAFVTGGIIGWGAVNTPETLGASNAISASIITGMAGGFYGDVTKQGIDIATGKQTGGLNYREIQNTSLITGATNGILQGVLPEAKIPGVTSGQGNMNAVGQAMRTKAVNGTISNISANTAFKSVAGSQAADLYRTSLGGVIDSVKSFISNKPKQ